MLSVIREIFSEKVLHRGFIYPVELLAPSNIKLVDPAADAGWGHFGSSCAIQSRPTPATQPLTRGYARGGTSKLLIGLQRYVGRIALAL